MGADLGTVRCTAMKPAPFAYHDPPDVDTAVALLADHAIEDDAVCLAGGQSLVPLLNLRLARPAVVIDLRRLEELRGWRIEPDAVRIGALTTAAALEASGEVAEALPLLASALAHIGHPQIRSRTTIGGSVAHADPAAELPAVLVALDATVELRGPSGPRSVPAAAFFRGPFTTARQAEELVTGVVFPRRAGLGAVVEVARRPGDFALVGIAGQVVPGPDGTVGEVALALFGVSGSPVRARAAEQALVGKPLSGEAIANAVAVVGDGLQPPSDIHGSSEYRRALAAVVTERFLGGVPTRER